MIRAISVSAALLLATVAAGAAGLKDVVQFDIVAQKLDTALLEFSRQAGVQVLTATEIVTEVDAPAIKGKMAPIDAIARLLEGTTLKFHTVGKDAIAIEGKKEAAATSAQAQTAKVLRLAQSGDGSPDPPVSQIVGHGNASISGHVKDTGTGVSLAGALVRVLETGESTQADDSGNFRLHGLIPQTYTLSISYLGYPDRLWRVDAAPGGATQEFALEYSAMNLEEVTVFGTRTSRALALNQQRTKENSSSVISADMLGNFTGTTISEALRRTEGIAFQRDPLTGDGTGIVIRGLTKDFNAVKLNGISLPSEYAGKRSEDDMGRSSDLSYLLADSVSKITVNYSLLPSHDSAGTGGLVEIETKSPLERPHRFANFSIEGARKGGDFGKDFLASGTLSGTFGEQRNVGLSGSIQYRERSVLNFNYNARLEYGSFQPLDEDGNTTIYGYSQVDPRETFPFEPLAARAFPSGVSSSLSDIDVKNLTASIAGAWRIGESTELRLDLERSTDRRDSFYRSSDLSGTYFSAQLPIAALGGEVRNTFGWAGYFSANQTFRSLQNVERITDTYAFNGSTTLGRLDLKYRLGYSGGTNRSPQETVMRLVFDPTGTGVAFDPAFVSADAVDPVEGRIITPWGERKGRGYPTPHLSPEGFAYFNDPRTYLLNDGSGYPIGNRIATKGYNYREDASSSARYNMNGKHFRYAEFGFEFERSKFAVPQRRTQLLMPRSCDSSTLEGCDTSADIGLDRTEGDLSAIGLDGRLLLPSRASFEAFANGLKSNASRPGYALSFRPSPLDPLEEHEWTAERNLSTYLQARVDVGRLEIIGGARLTRVEASTVNIVKPVFYHEGQFVPDPDFEERYTRLFEAKGTGTDLLPRVLINFRQSDNLIFRGGYFLTVARPSLIQIAAETDIFVDLNRFYGPTFDRPVIGVSVSNPGLKPARTDNFDLSAELYHGQLGLMRLSVFYKRTRNNILTNFFGGAITSLEGVSLPDIPELDDLPDDIYVQGSRPENSKRATELWGGTAGIERQFTFLPGFWSGFGVQTNITYTGSKLRDPYSWNNAPVYDDDGNLIGRYGQAIVEMPARPYPGQSKYSGTFAVTYNKLGIDASLAYTQQARALSGFDGWGLWSFNESYRTLDLRIAREMSLPFGKCTVFLEGTDLLKSTSSPDLEGSIGGEAGVPKFYTNGSFIGGRSFRLGARANF